MELYKYFEVWVSWELVGRYMTIYIVTIHKFFFFCPKATGQTVNKALIKMCWFNPKIKLTFRSHYVLCCLYFMCYVLFILINFVLFGV